MRCFDYRRWLSPYLEGTLADRRKTRLETHLQTCQMCSHDLESLKKLLVSLRNLRAAHASPDLLDGVHRKLQEEPWWRVVIARVTAPWPVSLPWHGLALATTAMLIVVVVGVPRSLQWKEVQRQRVQFAATPAAIEARNQPFAKQKAERRVSGVDKSPARYKASPPTELDEASVGVRGSWLKDQESKDAQVATPAVARDATVSGDARAKNPMAAPSSMAKNLLSRNTDTLRQDQAQSAMADSAPFNAAGAGTLKSDAEGTSRAADEKTVPLHVYWRVSHVDSAFLDVLSWVRAHHGRVLETRDRQIRLVLASADVPAFLERFSNEARQAVSATTPTLPPASAPAASSLSDQLATQWVTISLDLILAE